MAKVTSKTWCSVTPKYPPTAYMPFGIKRTSGNNFGYIPTSYIFGNRKTAVKEFLDSTKSLEKEEYHLEPLVFFLKMEFNRLLPLRKEHWTLNIEDNVTFNQKYIGFIECLARPSFYQVLVLPEGRYKGKWYLSPALAVPKTTTDNEIDQLFFHLEGPVDQTAKYAAVYDASELLLYDSNRNLWFTGEQVEALAKESKDFSLYN